MPVKDRQTDRSSFQGKLRNAEEVRNVGLRTPRIEGSRSSQSELTPPRDEISYGDSAGQEGVGGGFSEACLP